LQQERVRHIMVEAVVSIGIHEPITEAVRLFAEYPLHHLPVTDKSGLKGMLSSADMLKLEFFLPKTGARTTAAWLNDRFRIDALMRAPVITATLDDTIADAASRMVVNAVHSLPVVNEGNHLLGIVTTTDIMSALLHGIGLKPRSGQDEPIHKPTALEMRRAIEAAESAILNGDDADGVAATMLYLHGRNGILESLRQDVARYMLVGQDEQLHARLLQALDRSAQPGQSLEFPAPL
jgi:CBS domain-containing membrane protein